ncbi:sce7725 family protein [Xanthomonas perforans]
MGYHPYFRGKSNELICIKEQAVLIAGARMTPIIEPVRADLRPMKRCLDALAAAGSRAMVIANPGCGPLVAGLPPPIKKYIDGLVAQNIGISWLIRQGSAAGHAAPIPQIQGDAFLHDRVLDPSAVVAAEVQRGRRFAPHVFLDSKDAGVAYRANFNGYPRILLRDGFKKKKNAEYVAPVIEHFSDLHLTYAAVGFQGYGDFLSIGEEFSDKGGPAYAVAIHLTFVDPTQGGAVFIRHYVSDTNDTADDPALKFKEALSKLVKDVQAVGSLIPRTNAVNEFMSLYRRRHYPGLGYVKKLTMQHHIELMATI